MGWLFDSVDPALDSHRRSRVRHEHLRGLRGGEKENININISEGPEKSRLGTSKR